MKAFEITLNREGESYKCFIQKIANQAEDIYIVNFADTTLIRHCGASKTCVSIGRRGSRIAAGMILNGHLENHFWQAIDRMKYENKPSGH